jgi:galactitol PTS system EIIA component
VEHVLKPGLAVATLSAPVLFQNMVSPDEGVSCRLVFVMALDQPKAQIEMLQEIAGILQDPGCIKNLMSANDFEDVRAALAKVHS